MPTPRSRRSATLTFLDPSHSLNFDTDSPTTAAIYADRMIRVRYGVHVEELDRYVFATVFTGPVTGAVPGGRHGHGRSTGQGGTSSRRRVDPDHAPQGE